MGLMKNVLIVVLVQLIFVTNSYGAWQETVELLSGGWGAGADQFGIKYEDTHDTIPDRFYVLLNGSVIVRDLLNGRRKIYDNTGAIKTILKCSRNDTGELNEECRFKGRYLATNSAGNIWVDESKYKETKYLLYAPTGELIETYSSRPAELGIIKTKRVSASTYQTTATYPDKTFYLNKKAGGKYIRDYEGHINVVGSKSVKKYDACGKLLDKVVFPKDESKVVRPGGHGEDEFRELIAEYGKPVVGPNGDVYTWKRTPDTYSILKWIWQDSPTDSKGGPDAPLELQANPSITGVYLTWNPSPQDPGCVAGYDIERATSADGIYSKVTTVPLNEKQTYNYNDEGATAGATWYYKVKATSDIGDSDAATASAARP